MDLDEIGYIGVITAARGGRGGDAGVTRNLQRPQRKVSGATFQCYQSARLAAVYPVTSNIITSLPPRTYLVVAPLPHYRLGHNRFQFSLHLHPVETISKRVHCRVRNSEERGLFGADNTTSWRQTTDMKSTLRPGIRWERFRSTVRERRLGYDRQTSAPTLFCVLQTKYRAIRHNCLAAKSAISRLQPHIATAQSSCQTRWDVMVTNRVNPVQATCSTLSTDST
ncbi:hypothetical protein J6590_020615 [Homalodisca vitripennis]|nr:hypothetical protein J6590_020615 [Homalodisca vitripennis]